MKILLVLSVCFFSCNNSIKKIICPKENNYWDIDYYDKYFFKVPYYGYNIKRNGDCIYYIYEKKGNKRLRKEYSKKDDIIFNSKWNLEQDSILVLQNGKYKIVNLNKKKIILLNTQSLDSLIITNVVD